MEPSGPRPSTATALEREDVVWLSSTRPDGRPHLVAAWFVWDGESIVVVSKPHAAKVANVRHDPRVMVAIGEPAEDFDLELIEAEATLEPIEAAGLLCARFAGKYATRLENACVTIDRFLQVYSQAIRITPHRWLGWGGPGWAGGRAGRRLTAPGVVR